MVICYRRVRQNKNGRESTIFGFRRLLVTIPRIVFVELVCVCVWGGAKVEVRIVEFLMMLIATEGTVHTESTSYYVKSPNPNESQFFYL